MKLNAKTNMEAMNKIKNMEEDTMKEIYRGFEIISEMEGVLGQDHLPQRADTGSAGYDFKCAKDTVIPSMMGLQMKANEKVNALFMKHQEEILSEVEVSSLTDEELQIIEIVKSQSIGIEDAETLTKFLGLRGTLVPTGIKAKFPKDEVLKLYPRSSVGVKLLQNMPNDVGIVDSSYYNNPGNEGHIYVPLVNNLPFDIVIKKGDRIAQGIFVDYYTIDEEDVMKNERTGGIGSSN